MLRQQQLLIQMGVAQFQILNLVLHHCQSLHQLKQLRKRVTLLLDEVRPYLQPLQKIQLLRHNER